MTSNFSADVFLICLLEKRKQNGRYSYSVLYDYDFGPNYLRNVVMNIGSVDPNFTGSRASRSWKCTANDGIWKYLHTSGCFITM
jgi:hypothetical protein